MYRTNFYKIKARHIKMQTQIQNIQTNVQATPDEIYSTHEDNISPDALGSRHVKQWQGFSLHSESVFEQFVPTREVITTVCKEQNNRARFFDLLTQWDLQKGFTSSQDEIEACPAHLGILAMGWDAVPLIMEQIEKGVMNHWFMALELITCEQPVQIEDRGNYQKMGEVWLKWRKQN